jgi:hypothetical protein
MLRAVRRWSEVASVEAAELDGEGDVDRGEDPVTPHPQTSMLEPMSATLRALLFLTVPLQNGARRHCCPRSDDRI